MGLAPWFVFWRGQFVAGVLTLMVWRLVMDWERSAQRKEHHV
jgi:hypothetical protein